MLRARNDNLASSFMEVFLFKIDKSSNRISELMSKTFAELGFGERQHLQEWLANQPSALGEELLILQKEFDGFDDTRERLDLLALDKDGRLVIIENKLDDSGRDVVWQALKYASYCASLTTSQIIDIYQSYLDRYSGGGNSKTSICEFLNVPDIAEVVLNSGNQQRLMLVAANFRKEVTSSALWLLSHGIQLQCFKVTPFALADDLLLNVDQIIPTPEAKEFMIGMSVKEKEEKATKTTKSNSEQLRPAFWELTLEALRTSPVDLFNNISPSKDHWLSAGSGLRACPFSMIFGVKEVRVELYMSRSHAEENKFIFDCLFAQKDEIEKAFGNLLEWQRLDNRKASRIQFSKAFDGYNQENWPQMVGWLVTNIGLLESAFNNPLMKIKQSLKNNDHNKIS